MMEIVLDLLNTGFAGLGVTLAALPFLKKYHESKAVPYQAKVLFSQEKRACLIGISVTEGRYDGR